VRRPTTFVGDLHGRADVHRLLMLSNRSTFQLGDCGYSYGYLNGHDAELHKVLLGNHENYRVLRGLRPGNILPDYGTTFDGAVGFVRGAWSIDKAARTPGVDWFAEEELSYAELNAAADVLADAKPPIMASHDCPASVFADLKRGEDPGPFGAVQRRTRTGEALDEVLRRCKPTVWLFGHHHLTKVFTVGGTVFVALGVLCSLTLDLDDPLRSL
jgi:hypothetical protein